MGVHHPCVRAFVRRMRPYPSVDEPPECFDGTLVGIRFELRGTPRFTHVRRVTVSLTSPLPHPQPPRVCALGVTPSNTSPRPLGGRAPRDAPTVIYRRGHSTGCEQAGHDRHVTCHTFVLFCTKKTKRCGEGRRLSAKRKQSRNIHFSCTSQPRFCKMRLSGSALGWVRRTARRCAVVQRIASEALLERAATSTRLQVAGLQRRQALPDCKPDN